MQDLKHDRDVPFFILGSGRSGSTLLRMILSAHSRLTIPPESYFLIPLLEQFSGQNVLGTDEVNKAVDIITASYRWPDFKMDADQFRQTANALQQPRLRDILDVIYKAQTQREGKLRWGDKTPPYIKILPQIAVLYPDAKFIHLVRDGRDVSESFRRTGWYGRWLHDNTQEWKQAILAYEAYRQSDLAPRILNVRYEDLVLDLEKTVETIMAFLDEDIEQGMFHWEDDIADKIPEREAHIHRKLRRKPKASDINRWQSEMSARQIFVVEAFIGEELRRAGYECRFNGPFYPIPFFLTRLYCQSVLPVVSFCIRAIRFIGRRLLPRKNTQTSAQ